jgi:hypothetical protein
MEEGKNHTDHETRHTKQPGRFQIRLLNIGGKILKKALIHRINHHNYVTEYPKKNQ